MSCAPISKRIEKHLTDGIAAEMFFLYLCFMDLVRIGKNIRIARAIRGYSQGSLAKSVGKSQNWLQKVEKGEVEISVSCMRQLAEELNVDAQQMMFGSFNELLPPPQNDG